MTITLNFTSIFAWIGGLVCLVVMLWILGWLTRGAILMGEFLGLWASLGRGIEASTSWVWSKLGRQSKD